MSRPLLSCLAAALLLGSTPAAFAASELGFYDHMFLETAIHGSASEVMLGQLALTNAGSSEVKSLGQMLIDDHSKARDEAAALVRRMGVPTTTDADSDGAEEWEKLKNVKGEAFDKEFVRYMVEDHKHDVMAFRRESLVKDGPAKDFAARTLPTLQKHLEMAEALAAR